MDKKSVREELIEFFDDYSIKEQRTSMLIRESWMADAVIEILKQRTIEELCSEKERTE